MSQTEQRIMELGTNKIFALTQSAFYLFLIKLSIHFTRFQEGVHRFSSS
jgi:hypothetical protein